MTTADEIQTNSLRRQEIAAASSTLNTELFTLVKRGYSEGISVPELARLAHVTRGRIYQILKDK